MKRTIQKYLAIAACALALGACASPAGTDTQTAAQSPQVAVYAAKGAYEAALTVAVAYAKLPRCEAATGPICSSPPVLAQVERARAVAHDAIASAEGAVRTPGFGADVLATAVSAAQASLTALTAITTTLRTK